VIFPPFFLCDEEEDDRQLRCRFKRHWWGLKPIWGQRKKKVGSSLDTVALYAIPREREREGPWLITLGKKTPSFQYSSPTILMERGGGGKLYFAKLNQKEKKRGGG